MKNKFKIANIVILVSLFIAIAFLIISFIPQIKFLSNTTYNSLLKDALARSFFAIFLMCLAFYSSNRSALTFSINRRLILFSIPPLLVALANFPFSSLIKQDAIITAPEYIGLLIFYCLSVAIVEEIFFRIMLFNYVLNYFNNKKNKFLIAVIITSLLFGLWHLFDLIYGAPIIPTLLQVIYTFLLGCLFSVTYYKIKNIWIIVFVHMLFNIGGYVITFLGTGTIQDTIFWIVTLSVGTLVGFHTLLLALRINKDINLNEL